MSALPRPDLPQGPLRELNDALHDLHHRAGWPSLRTLAREAACSHTTVSAVLSRPRLPAWGNIELLVEAMAGDVAEFHRLWLAASAGPRGEAPAPELAGRAAELVDVRRHVESGTGLLVVTGEAGVGKTRLVTTAVRSVVERHHVAVGACLPLSTEVPLLPVVDALRTIALKDDGAWFRDALAACSPYVAASLGRLLPEAAALATVEDPDDEWSRQRLFTAVATLLPQVAERRSGAILLEDLHWADPATLDLVEHLVARSEVRLLGTWRRDDPDTPESTREWWARLQRSAAVRTCALDVLSRDETATQLRLQLGTELAAGVVDRIHARSGGLPLFTEQLAEQPAPEEGFPALLSDVLDRRLGGLGPDAALTAQALGVADRPLGTAALAQVTGVTDSGAALRELADRRLLTSGADDVQLRHPLLAEAARRGLLGPERTELHRRIAAVLGAAPDASAAEVATHWQAAGDLEQELAWRVAAATAAGERHAWAIEAAQWQRALELWPRGRVTAGDPPVRLVDAYVRAITAEEELDVDRAAELAEEALLMAETLDAEEAALLWSHAGGVVNEAGNPVRGLALLERAQAVYETLPPSAAFVRTLMRIDDVLLGTGQYEAAGRAVRLASEVCAELDEPDLTLLVETDRAWQQASAGDLDGALERAWRARARARPNPALREEIRASSLLTDILLMAAAPASEVVEVGAAGMTAAETWGVDGYSVAIIRFNLATAWLRAGDVGEAAQLIDPVSDDEPDINRWALHLMRAEIDIARGRLDAAADRMTAVSEWDLHSVSMRAEVLATSARVHLWRDEDAAAVDLLEPFLAEVAGTEAAAGTGNLFLLVARAAAGAAVGTARGARTQAVGRLRALLAACTGDPFDAAAGDRARRVAMPATWRAELTRLAGESDPRAWTEAAAAWDGLGRPHDAAYCRWRAAQALPAGQGTAAGRLLRRAAAEARGHQPLTEAIRGTATRRRAGPVR